MSREMNSLILGFIILKLFHVNKSIVQDINPWHLLSFVQPRSAPVRVASAGMTPQARRNQPQQRD